MVKVFRIQDKNGNGPYFKYKVKEWATRDHNNWNDIQVAPEFDGLKNPTVHKDYVYGFSSIIQLYKWFNKEELISLEKLGLNIWEFLINKNNVEFGKKQVRFIISNTGVIYGNK